MLNPLLDVRGNLGGTLPGKYQRIDMHRGLARGWSGPESTTPLNGTEHQILSWVSSFGHAKEPGLAFTWHPYQGIPPWAASMGIHRLTFQRSIRRLMERQILVEISLSHDFKWGRGYGIPNAVADSCVTYKRTISNVSPPAFSSSTNETDRFNNEQITRPESIDNEPGPVNGEHDQVDAESGQFNNDQATPPLTRAFASLVQREEYGSESTKSTNPASQGRRRRRVSLTTTTANDTDWAAPSEVEDHSWGSARVEPSKRVSTPGHRLSVFFGDQRNIALQSSPDLAPAWSNKAAINARFKALLDEYSEEDLRVFIEVFFLHLERFRLKGDVLWKDFYNSIGKIRKIAITTGDLVIEVEEIELPVRKWPLPPKRQDPPKKKHLPGGIDYEQMLKDMNL